MKKVTSLIIGLLLTIGLFGCGETAPSYYGVWTIDSLLPEAPLGNFNEEDMGTIQASNLTFSAEQASCFGDQIDSLGQSVSNPEYIEMDIPKDSFESMVGVSFDSLGISGSKVTQVSVVNDPSYNNGIVFYIIDDNTLLANSLGTFFILKRAE